MNAKKKTNKQTKQKQEKKIEKIDERKRLQRLPAESNKNLESLRKSTKRSGMQNRNLAWCES